MEITNKLSDFRVVDNNIIEVHCVEKNGDKIIGHWRTTLQKDSNISVLTDHCSESDIAKVQEHLDLLEETTDLVEEFEKISEEL